jgi:hypothetical protein
MAAKRTNKFGLLYCNFAYSALTCFRMGMSRSASFFSRQMQIERINLLRADVTREQRHITGPSPVHGVMENCPGKNRIF